MQFYQPIKDLKLNENKMAQINEEETTTKSLDSTFESIIIDIPQAITFSSASSSSYDTDSSVNSTTCCTKHHNDHLYMQKPQSDNLTHQHMQYHHHHHHQHHFHQQSMEMKSSSLNSDMEAVYFKADHRKSWPVFILMISLLEVSI